MGKAPGGSRRRVRYHRPAAGPPSFHPNRQGCEIGTSFAEASTRSSTVKRASNTPPWRIANRCFSKSMVNWHLERCTCIAAASSRSSNLPQLQGPPRPPEPMLRSGIRKMSLFGTRAQGAVRHGKTPPLPTGAQTRGAAVDAVDREPDGCAPAVCPPPAGPRRPRSAGRRGPDPERFGAVAENPRAGASAATTYRRPAPARADT